MKRTTMAALVGVLGLALAGCGGSQTAPATTETTQEEQAVDSGQAVGGNEAADQQEQASEPVVSGSPEDVLASMQADFSDTAQKLYDEQSALFEKVGDTFDGYVSNVDAVESWYALTVSETEALGERVLENSKAYYQAVIDSIDVTDGDAVSDAIEAYYDAIYDDAYGDYYDAVYDDLYKQAFDQFYDGILSDAFDTEEYGEVSDVRSDEYDFYSDYRSDVYDAIFDARSEVYDLNSEAWSAYYDNEFTLDEIFRESVVNIKKN